MEVSFRLVAVLAFFLIHLSDVFGQTVSKKCYDLSRDFVEEFKCGRQFHLGVRVSSSENVKEGEYPW